MSTETWRPVTGFESVYEVSDLGRVRSLNRIDPLGRPRKGRILHPARHRDGHLHVRLSLNGAVYTRWVHRLVLDAFSGPCPPGQEACHWNGDAADNRAINLRWDTRSGNWRDRIRHAELASAR